MAWLACLRVLRPDAQPSFSDSAHYALYSPAFLPQFLQLALHGPGPLAPAGHVGSQAAGHLLLNALLPGPAQLSLLQVLLLLPLPGLKQAPGGEKNRSPEEGKLSGRGAGAQRALGEIPLRSNSP